MGWPCWHAQRIVTMAHRAFDSDNLDILWHKHGPKRNHFAKALSPGQLQL